MITFNDFWNILDSIGGQDVPELDTSVKILADSEKAKVKSFFEATLDQPSFSTDDYKRLRSFLIDLFSSHRTISTIQKQISDVFSLPLTSLDELIKSFGYSVSLDRLDDVTKATFFLDLVNLYKLKGTPAGLVQVLNYYGLTNIELAEYWLFRDSTSMELVFRGVNVLQENTLDVPWADVDYDSMTFGDPHWLLTKAKAEQAIALNKIALPSKSPYIGIRPTTSMTEIELTTIILAWQIQNDFATWQSSGVSPDRDLNISLLNMMTSILGLYLASIYSINTLYNLELTGFGNATDPFLCYNGSETIISDIVDEFWTFVHDVPLTRDAKDQKVLDYINLYTKPNIEKFAQTRNEVETYFTALEPDIKTVCDMWIQGGHGEELINGLLGELASWCQINISITYASIASAVMGISSLEYIRNVIEFFKPYRARIKDIEHAYLFDDRVRNTIIVEDMLEGITETETFVDFDTANSHPGWQEGWLPGGYITSTPLANQYQVTDIFSDPFGTIDAVNELTLVPLPAVYINSTPAVGQYRVTNMYISDGPTGNKRLVVEYEDTVTLTAGVSSLIRSTPPTGSYRIRDIVRDDLGRFLITYDETFIEEEWDAERIYYSRETYDCGSFFDIGAAYDVDHNDEDGPSLIEINYTDDLPERINAHPADSSVYTYYRYVDDGL